MIPRSVSSHRAFAPSSRRRHGPNALAAAVLAACPLVVGLQPTDASGATLSANNGLIAVGGDYTPGGRSVNTVAHPAAV